MLDRRLEPEVMDTEAEAVAYDAMDFQAVNQAFVETAIALGGPSLSLGVLDVGTGTGRIPILLAHLRPAWEITGIDLARSMLAIAGDHVRAAGYGDRIRLEFVDAKCLPYADQCFDGVISNSLLHHLPRPLDCLREIKRVLKPEGFLLIRDLLRPPSWEQLQAQVQAIAEEYDDTQRQLFQDSLHAALTLGELQNYLADLHWTQGPEAPRLYQSSDRHWTLERPWRGKV